MGGYTLKNMAYEKIVDKELIRNSISRTNHSEASTYFADFMDKRNERIVFDQKREKYFINSFFPSLPSKAWDRMTDSLYQIMNGERKLFAADVVVTGRCHCSCWHCYRIKHCNVDLGFEQIKGFIEQCNELGVSTLGITGGEPMLRNDILDIIKCIPDGMEGQLYTTGHKINDEFCKQIKNTNLSRVIVSLDHFDENVVVKTKNNPRAYKETLEAIDCLTRNEIYTTVTVCILPEFTYEEINKYFDFVSNLGIQEVRVVLPIPQGKLEGQEVKNTYFGAKKLVKDIKKKNLDNPNYPNIILFCEFESGSYFGCSAGAHYVSVNNDGNITPCVAVPLSFGNIYEEPLNIIYERMKKFFQTSGPTCYGRKTGKVICDMGIDTSITPLCKEISEEVARQYIVKGRRSSFYEDFKNFGDKNE